MGCHKKSLFAAHNLEAQIQAPAGPHRESSTYKDSVGVFSLFCERHANTKNISKHPINTRKSCEHAFGVRKIPNLHLLIIISNSQSHFSTEFLLFGGKAPFWCSQVVFARCIILNISNTNKFLGVIITFSNFFSSIALLIHYHPTTFFTPTFTEEYTHFL